MKKILLIILIMMSSVAGFCKEQNTGRIVLEDSSVPRSQGKSSSYSSKSSSFSYRSGINCENLLDAGYELGTRKQDKTERATRYVFKTANGIATTGKEKRAFKKLLRKTNRKRAKNWLFPEETFGDNKKLSQDEFALLVARSASSGEQDLCDASIGRFRKINDAAMNLAAKEKCDSLNSSKKTSFISVKTKGM